MPLPVYHLRRWLVAIAVVCTLVVAAMYLRVRWHQLSVLKALPGKMGIDLKQTETGFQYSQSDGGRTLFSIQASDLKEFKLDGRAELHNVSIVLYGRDSSRFDRIYGDDFSYDPKSGDVIAKGDVQIDLEANPAGRDNPDQSAPMELKTPIHLKTRDLVFNRETGNAITSAKAEFRTPQASGSAVGVQYSGKTNTLILASQVHVEISSGDHTKIDPAKTDAARVGAKKTGAKKVGVTKPDATKIDETKIDETKIDETKIDTTKIDTTKIDAATGLITGDPRIVLLDHPSLVRGAETMQADQAKMFLNADNNVERILAEGNVRAQLDEVSQGHHLRGVPTQKRPAQSQLAQNQRAQDSHKQDPHKKAQPAETLVTSDQADFLLMGKQNQLRTAILTGHVELQRAGAQSMQGSAGRVILDYAGQNQLQKVHALDHVRLTQAAANRESDSAKNSNSNFVLTAPAVDLFVADGRFLDRGETFGPAQITIVSSPVLSEKSAASPSATNAVPQQTVVTAAKFTAKFETVGGSSHFESIHGAPDAHIVNQSPGQPTRTSVSETVDATFLPQGGIATVTQQGKVTYSDDQAPDKRTQATADQARYTPADQMLALSGSPRVVEGGTATTANIIRINRATGEAFAEGDVKSTYSELQEQPNGSLLASSSPIHVTAKSMTARDHPAIAIYSGNARLWQDANLVEAPTIQFDRDHRSLVAQGTAAKPVSTTLIQPDKMRSGTAEPEPAKPSQRERPEPTKHPKRPGSAPKSDTPGPVTITSALLTYTDSERKAHYEGGVSAQSPDFTASAQSMDVYLLPRSQTTVQAKQTQSLTGQGQGQGQVERVVAQGHVVVQQPNRRATGETLVYTTADDKFVLTGGPPSIFDAEQGEITGDSLTFFRADDRVLVEGEASTPVVTKTRVAR